MPIKKGSPETECGRNATVEENIFQYTGANDLFEEVGAVKILEPLNSEFNYFEVEIISKGRNCAIGIGVGDRDYPLNLQPGWNLNGVGYHADDGKIFNDGDYSVHLSGETCTKDDRMGCGVAFEEDTAGLVSVFFTKNGRQIDYPVKMKKPASSLYSIIGMHSEGEEVRYLGCSSRAISIDLQKVSCNY